MPNNEEIISASKICSEITNKCPICNGSGKEVFEAITEESISIYGENVPVIYTRNCPYCNGGHIKKVEEVQERANIPSAFYSSRLKDFNWSIYQDEQGKIINLEKQKQIIDSFIEKFTIWESKGIGLYIYSHMKGSGKTYLASCICNELISKYPMNTKFVSASELIEIQKRGSNTGTEYERDPIELLCNCKLLCIDDLGQKQVGVDWTNDILFRIMDNRIQRKLVTIITSNIPINELQIDDRVVDRINNICSPIPLPEYCVRSRKSKQEQVELFKELGLINSCSA